MGSEATKSVSHEEAASHLARAFETPKTTAQPTAEVVNDQIGENATPEASKIDAAGEQNKLEVAETALDQVGDTAHAVAQTVTEPVRDAVAAAEGFLVKNFGTTNDQKIVQTLETLPMDKKAFTTNITRVEHLKWHARDLETGQQRDQ